MIVLDLSGDDHAVRSGILRRALAIRTNKPSIRGLDETGEIQRFFYEVNGCRGELAGHRLFKADWQTAYSETPIDCGDLYGFIEFKAVIRPKDRLLIKAEKLKPDHAYVLMDGTFHPCWHEIGWIWGREVKDEWRDRFDNQPDCYIVPRSMPPLRPVRELLALVNEKQRAAE